VVPDDDPPDAFDDEPTSLDALGPIPVAESSGPVAVPERNTKTYSHSAEFLAGREAGYKQGIDAAITALREELVKAGCTRDEIAHIVARIRANTDQDR
jgi:hypothetical protein